MVRVGLVVPFDSLNHSSSTTCWIAFISGRISRICNRNAAADNETGRYGGGRGGVFVDGLRGDAQGGKDVAEEDPRLVFRVPVTTVSFLHWPVLHQRIHLFVELRNNNSSSFINETVIRVDRVPELKTYLRLVPTNRIKNSSSFINKTVIHPSAWGSYGFNKVKYEAIRGT